MIQLAAAVEDDLRVPRQATDLAMLAGGPQVHREDIEIAIAAAAGPRRQLMSPRVGERHATVLWIEKALNHHHHEVVKDTPLIRQRVMDQALPDAVTRGLLVERALGAEVARIRAAMVDTETEKSHPGLSSASERLRVNPSHQESAV